ncbi:outer membrane protein [Pleomorphomonas sp. PLEO]|uniref:outer membrane protein n=1 Tax=Pleomorphomonas sp. PLEO TaxID=3239306 RepID=UPI00351EFCCA
MNFAMISPVAAADLPTPDAPEYPASLPSTAFDWSGLYVGAQAGYVINQIGLTDSEDLKSGSFGMFGGYNFVYSGVVVGVENDVNYNWSDGETVGLDWDGSVRGRVGYAWDRVLFYGTAGLAAASGSVDLGRTKKEDILVGWTAGVGAEYAITDNILARAEYRYSDFGSVDFGGSIGEFKADQNKVSLGVAYKF